MAANIYLVIGGMGQGKTHFVRKTLIKDKPCFIFDVNGEHNDLPLKLTAPQSRYLLGTMDEFIRLCSQKHEGTFCVFEDATGFLSGATGKPMKALIVAKRHPVELGGRNIVLFFHSIQTVPPFLFDTAEYCILFKTADDIASVKKKRASLLPAFIALRNATKYSKRIIKLI